MLWCQGQDSANEVKLSQKKQKKLNKLNNFLMPQISCEKKEIEVWGFVTGRPRLLQIKR